MSPSIVALSPTINSFFETILPLNRPSMRIVSSNSSSPLNTAPLSRNPLSSPLLLPFIVASRSNHQRYASDHPRLRSECESPPRAGGGQCQLSFEATWLFFFRHTEKRVLAL